jgi:hypothetical protein
MTHVSEPLPDLSKYQIHLSGVRCCEVCGREFEKNELFKHEFGVAACGNIQMCWSEMCCGLGCDGQLVPKNQKPSGAEIEAMRQHPLRKPLKLEDFGLTLATQPTTNKVT